MWFFSNSAQEYLLVAHSTFYLYHLQDFLISFHLAINRGLESNVELFIHFPLELVLTNLFTLLFLVEANSRRKPFNPH